MGEFVQTGGDSLLIVFDSIDGAVRCAMNVQRQMPNCDGDQPPDRAIRFRVGINIGDAIADGTDLHGDAVNVVVRLQAECPPGDICVSRSVRDHIHGRLGLEFEELGPLSLKNIARPVEAFVLRPDGTTVPKSLERSLLHGTGEALPLPDKPSIAVLAFSNMSGDAEQDYISDGIADDIITELSRSRSLFVIARNSSFTYKGRSVDVKLIARELGVRYVVEGSVRRSGSRIRVNAQLIDSEIGNHIWAERYDRDVSDILAVQDEIASEVITAILPAMTDAEQRRALRKPIEHLGAWEAYQRGLWHMSRPNPSGFSHARDFFQQALMLDATFAPPNYRLAFLLIAEASLYRTRSIQDAVALAEQLTQRAVELDPCDADAQAMAAIVSIWRGEWDGAMSRAGQAVQTNPNSVVAHRALGSCLISFGRYSEARNEFLTCLRINSRDPTNWVDRRLLGMAFFYEHAYQLAADALEQASRIAPNYPEVQMNLAAALGQLGQIGKAQDVLRRAMNLIPPADRNQVPTIVPRRCPEDLELYLEGLRKAGWQG